MVTDEELVKISGDIDEFLLDQIVKNNVEPLNLAAIILARLIRMSQDSKTEEQFYKLVESVNNKKHLEYERKTLQ
jgi:hypothetical protein